MPRNSFLCLNEAEAFNVTAENNTLTRNCKKNDNTVSSCSATLPTTCLAQSIICAQAPTDCEYQAPYKNESDCPTCGTLVCNNTDNCGEKQGTEQEALTNDSDGLCI